MVLALGRWRYLGAMTFVVALIPLMLLVYRILNDQLGVDSAKEIVLNTGMWAAIFLWLSLYVTPLKRRVGIKWLMKYRRMLGLYAFFYALLHGLAFVTFICGWRVDILSAEISKSPFIVVGAFAVIGMLPLALTSTKKMQKKLGKRWGILHRAVYIISLFVLLHIIWMVRASYLDAILFSGLLALALAERVLFSWQRSHTS